MHAHLSSPPQHPDALDLWLARGAIVVIAALQLVLVNDLAPGPRGLVPSVEMALLLPLSAATVWVRGRARRAVTDYHRTALARYYGLVRWAAGVLTSLVTAINAASLIAVVRALLAGQARNAPPLLPDALNVAWSRPALEACGSGTTANPCP